MMNDVIVVGAGPAGVSAAVQCKRLGLDVVLLDKTGAAGGLISNAYQVENYPGLEAPVPGPIFAERLSRFVNGFDIPIHKECVSHITPHITTEGTPPSGWRVQTDFRELSCRGVVVACGTTPQPLSFLGRDLVENHGLVFHEVNRILERFSKPSVVIVGGGEASFDYALSIARSGGTATILCRGHSPRVQGRLAALVSETPAITLMTQSELIRARVEPTAEYPPQVEIEINHGASGCCTTLARQRRHALLVAVGRKSLCQTLLDKSLCASNHLTPAPGLFICGDARLGTLGQAGIAVGDGLHAAQQLLEMIGRYR
ncbi:MAG: NAD(P)/FAD-dependent oxidoreductase [Deltaproteobacteria bacterium]|nr:NAD(P)/FAD-dependent oxidoreductase [Deltaproteobacteria bacterium]MBN2673011.1 NAD(P)/FAD-dependent oxidoreductase [Deltaproteobacteria bacterium]